MLRWVEGTRGRPLQRSVNEVSTHKSLGEQGQSFSRQRQTKSEVGKVRDQSGWAHAANACVGGESTGMFV